MSAYNAMEMAQIKNQIAQYEANRAAAESIINDANEKIERLRPVKKILEDNKGRSKYSEKHCEDCTQD